MMITYSIKYTCIGYNNDITIYLINHVQLMYKNRLFNGMLKSKLRTTMVLSFATALSNSGIYFYNHAVAYETQKARAVTNIPFSFITYAIA